MRGLANTFGLILATAFTLAGGQRTPQTPLHGSSLPTYRYDSVLPHPYLWYPMSYFLVNSLVDAFVVTVPVEGSQLRSDRSAELAKRLLTIMDTPIVVAAVKAGRSAEKPKSPQQALAVGLVLWASSPRTPDGPGDARLREGAREALRAAIHELETSAGKQDKIDLSFADLALALLESEARSSGWEQGLRLVARKYDSLFPERSMMALCNLAWALHAAGLKDEAKRVAREVVRKYMPGFSDWAAPWNVMNLTDLPTRRTKQR